MHNVKLEYELMVISPNDPGILGRILGTLANAQINLRAFCAYTDQDKGVFLLLVSDDKKAQKVMKALGYEVNRQQVLTVMMDDRIGAGAEIGALLGNAVIDIEYCYGSTAGSGKALLVCKTSNNRKALETLS